MKPLPRLAGIASVFLVVSLTSMLVNLAYGQTGETIGGVASPLAAIADPAVVRKKEQRREFQLQELMLAKTGGWIFKLGETPRVLWRDIETVRRLGCIEPLQVRWFNAELNESVPKCRQSFKSMRPRSSAWQTKLLCGACWATNRERFGIHWQRHLKPGVPRDSKRDEDLLFGPNTLGHGSFSGCIFLVDLDLELVVVQIRKQSGPRSGEWSPKFFETIAAVLSE